MVFNTGAALLDAIVLAVVSREENGVSGAAAPFTGEVPGGLRPGHRRAEQAVLQADGARPGAAYAL